LAQEDPPFAEYYRKQARAAVATVTPLIRAAALEEAAQAFEPPPDSPSYRRWGVEDIAAHIRSLKEQP